MPQPILIRHLGLCEYQSTLQAMQAFTAKRDAGTKDELWLLQHPPVFTQGVSGKQEHVLDPGTIPVVRIDRGGQVTYHGPGQLVVYCLLDLKRSGLGARDLVTRLEQSVIDLLAAYSITAQNRRDVPGVYVADKKLASLGLRIRKGCSYHGLSVNVDMDLTPFKRINPCGYAGLEMTQLSEFYPQSDIDTISRQLVHHLAENLGYTIESFMS